MTHENKKTKTNKSKRALEKKKKFSKKHRNFES